MVAIALSLAVAGGLLGSASAHADFGIQAFDGQVTAGADGSPYTQAGGHPYDASVSFDLNTKGPDPMDFAGFAQIPDENIKDLMVDLPAGFVGNPSVASECTEDRLETQLIAYGCPLASQVGFLTVRPGVLFGKATGVGIFNMVPRDGVVAEFGANIQGKGIVHMTPVVQSDGDYSLRIETKGTPQSVAVTGVTATFWGVPADPSHDELRTTQGCSDFFGAGMDCSFSGGGGPSGVPPRPFLTNPFDCSAGPLTTTMRANSWQTPSEYVEASFVSHLPPAFPAPPEEWGAPQGVTGCDGVPFDPALAVRPDSSSSDSATGLKVDLSFPTDGLDDPDGVATAPLRDLKVTLPEGMSINPSGADGLAACTDEELALKSMQDVACPGASRIGGVTATTPLIAERLDGGIFIRTQASDDPESGDMFRVAVVLRNAKRGLLIKLPGSVKADAETGRLEATFVDNPQLPVANIVAQFKSGGRAPLATPRTCDTHLIDAALTSWSANAVSLADSFDIACSGEPGFAPEFVAGAVDATAGVSTPFALRIGRSDGQENLREVSIDLPQGLMAKLRGVPQCATDRAAAGTCGSESRVGSATAGAGAGTPFVLANQPVYLAGPYNGAPFSLSVVAHAKAGPFDLGKVVVRQALRVDPEDARVTVVSDPLPTILKGVPLRVRSIDVEVDRPGFTVNPTSCATKQIKATLRSLQGSSRAVQSRFRVGDCAALAFKPRLGLRLVGKRQMRSGGHPALRATVKQGRGEANIRRARVTLPRNVVLDATNSADPKLLCGYDASLKADCPKSTIIGKASLSTPILGRKLSGPVHLVQGIRFENGNRIRGLPTLLVKLRGEVSINLRSQTAVDSRDRLVSIFPKVPDAAVSKFSLQVNGGKKGILVVTENRQGRINLCNQTQTALVKTEGHNGKRADYPVRVKPPCTKKRTR